MDADRLLLLPLWYAAFLLSVTCHEAAHAFIAWRGGDSTAYHGGQVSLNPVPHVRREIFGTVLVPLLTYMNMGWMMGWASAPYDPDWEQRHPRRAALMAAAGPAANLVLALIALAALKWGLGAEVWIGPDYCCAADELVVPMGGESSNAAGLGRFLSIVLTLNVLLMLFNLIPLPPLDGASIVSGLIDPAREPMERLRQHPMGSLIGILIAWFVFSRVPLIAILRDWLLYPGMYGS